MQAAGHVRQLGTAQHKPHTDAFSAAARRVQESAQAGRWGEHMASRMSRSLAEGDSAGYARTPRPGHILLLHVSASIDNLFLSLSILERNMDGLASACITLLTPQRCQSSQREGMLRCSSHVCITSW